MNWPYFHMIINHFPIILGVMGAAAAVLGLLVPRREVWLYALASLTLAALSAYPAVFTGERAEHVLEEAWYVQAGALEEHEESGKLALWVKLATGIVSAWAWRRTVKGEQLSGLPGWLCGIVVAGALASALAVGYWALEGWRIIHSAPVLLRPEPPPGYTPPAIRQAP